MFSERKYVSDYLDLKQKAKLSNVYGRFYEYSKYIDYSKITNPKIMNFPPFIEPSYLKILELEHPYFKVVVEIPLFVYSLSERKLRALLYN